MFSSGNTPREIVTKLNREAADLFGTPAVRQALAVDGIEATSSTPEALAAFLQGEIAKWGKMVRESGAKPE